ncbi:hypothetical protein V3C99_014841, partial [Haemonchus contortus]
GTLFAAASAALAAQAVLMDDRQPHEVVAFVPSMTALPVLAPDRSAQDDVRILLVTRTSSRRMDYKLIHGGTDHIALTSLNFTDQGLSVELHSERRTQRAVYREIERYGSVDRNTHSAQVHVSSNFRNRTVV